MKITTFNEKYDLTNESIDIISASISKTLAELKYEKRNKIALQYSIENYLLDYQSRLGADARVIFSVSSKLGRQSLIIKIEGEEFNPSASDELGIWNTTLMENLSVVPSITYSNGYNVIKVILNRPEMNPIIKLLISIVAGGAIGGIGFLLPDATRELVNESLLHPIYSAFLGVLSVVGLSLVLLSVVSGITEAGDISTFSRIGKRLVATIFGTNTIVLLGIFVIGLGVFDLNYSGAYRGSSQFGEVFKLVLNILPSNLIAPFSDGNALQIMVIAIAIGVALLALGDSAKQASRFFDQMFGVSLYIMEAIEKLLPIFISIVVVDIMWSSELKEVAGMWRLVVIGIAFCLAITVVMVVATAINNKISPFKLFKKIMPTYLLALSTASSSAVHGTCVECCKEKLGIDSRLTTFGVSFATGIFKPATGVIYIITALYLADMYDIEVSAMWIITAFVICLIMSVATPPIAGGSAIAYTIIFAQLGIPSRILAVVLALDVIFDFVAIATDKVYICTSLLNIAKKNDMLDYSKLNEN